MQKAGVDALATVDLALDLGALYVQAYIREHTNGVRIGLYDQRTKARKFYAEA